MKKLIIIIFVLLLVAAGCTPAQGKTPGTEQNADAALLTSAQTAAKAGPVIAPNELLSAGEASELTGQAVTFDEGSLNTDKEGGFISERYKYDLGSSTVHALVQIEQDGLKTAGDAKKAYVLQKKMLGDDVTAADLGDGSFTVKDTGQLHMLYNGYYVIVAFDADEYETTENAALNTKIGKRILENLKDKLAP